MPRYINSIRPLNLLSFGPATEEIELRDLNILIGPNGCGKSNLIELLGLLRSLTDKKPWARVTATGGYREWLWKGANQEKVDGNFDAGLDVISMLMNDVFDEVDCTYRLRVDADAWRTNFAISLESITPSTQSSTGPTADILRENDEISYPRKQDDTPSNRPEKIPSDVSILGLPAWMPYIFEFKDIFERIGVYRDWVFGSESKSRGLEQIGLESSYLEEDGSNLAHVLNFILTHESNFHGEKLRQAFRKFSNDARDIETRIREGFIQLRVREASGISTPAVRLSDGTLRWLSLLAILLNPSPRFITCIEEPELGLHPDMIPTLAELLRDASRQTQLVITTHSQSLVECFTDAPEAVCVCEKVEGTTTIKRLEAERLKIWLNDYSLGQLWASGQIGGNRW